MSAGIDYGLGKVNVDQTTGIRYGVIHSRELGQSWYDSSEGDYGEPACPKCGGKVVDYDDDKHDNYVGIAYDYACEPCRQTMSSDYAWPESPIAWYYDDDGYMMEQSGDDCDIFITQSPYFTYCVLCSPCAPGAGYIMEQLSPETGIRAYCPGPGWFEDGAPFRIYNVESEEEIIA